MKTTIKYINYSTTNSPCVDSKWYWQDWCRQPASISYGNIYPKQKTETKGAKCQTEHKGKNKIVKWSPSYVFIRHTLWTITWNQLKKNYWTDAKLLITTRKYLLTDDHTPVKPSFCCIGSKNLTNGTLGWKLFALCLPVNWLMKW